MSSSRSSGQMHLTAIAAVTERLGLAATVSISYQDSSILKAGLSTLASHLDVDLSRFALDQPLPTVDVPGVHGDYLEVAEVTQAVVALTLTSSPAGP